jgi:hypothetical protein
MRRQRSALRLALPDGEGAVDPKMADVVPVLLERPVPHAMSDRPKERATAP